MASVIHCPKCGKANPGTNKFCEECGTPLEHVQAAEPSTTQVATTETQFSGAVMEPVEQYHTKTGFTGFLSGVGYAFVFILKGIFTILAWIFTEIMVAICTGVCEAACSAESKD
ncbi:MAG: zinc-ribbon domain-containing protein [Candidatus Heimdallarchaeaceae archaeon]